VHTRRVNILRPLSLLALLMTLPGYGLAGVTHVRSCQEQMDSAQLITAAGDCCPGKTDLDTPYKRGRTQHGQKDPCGACKAGFNCKSPQSFEPVTFVSVFFQAARPPIPVEPSPLLLAHSPDRLWRPPCLI
jgi:hypothetical protein